MAKKKERKKQKQNADETAAESRSQQAANNGETTSGTAADADVDVLDPEEKAPSEEDNQKIEEIRQEMNDKYMRAKAELDNFRKRSQRELREMREYTKANTVQEFFSVFDHFQMAMDHVKENPDVETLKQGMDMILTEFRRTLEALGVERIESEGKPFDPNEHEAMTQEPSETVPAGRILRQWKCGYRMGDRLLRPAKVVVSTGSKDDETTGDTGDKGAGTDGDRTS